MVGFIKSPQTKKHFENVTSRIANVQAERQDFTHGLWDWDYETPAQGVG